jgi:hypothetical protein
MLEIATPEMLINFCSSPNDEYLPIEHNENKTINSEEIKKDIRGNNPDLTKFIKDDNFSNNNTPSNSSQKITPPTRKQVVVIPIQGGQMPNNTMLPLTQSLLYDDKYGREILDDFRPENINNSILLNRSPIPGQNFGLTNPLLTPINQGVRQVYDIKDFL